MLVEATAVHVSHKNSSDSRHSGLSWISCLSIPVDQGCGRFWTFYRAARGNASLAVTTLRTQEVNDLKIVAFCRHLVWLYSSHFVCRPRLYKFPCSHTLCPGIYKCFELGLPSYFRCPAFIRQVFNRVHQALSVINMLALIGSKTCDLLINLGIRKIFLNLR